MNGEENCGMRIKNTYRNQRALNWACYLLKMGGKMMKEWILKNQVSLPQSRNPVGLIVSSFTYIALQIKLHLAMDELNCQQGWPSNMYTNTYATSVA